jgi:hypothetical protein
MATPAQIAANQANSQKSTGPKSADGKARSSRNSFKHGLYAKELVLPNEDPAELDQLRAFLRAEHQPINTTEEMLVNDLAENFWRLRRMREFETRAMQPENIHVWHDSGLLAVVQRTMASAERGFHKTLGSLRRLQKDRDFVPQPSHDSEDEIGFVPEQSAQPGTIRDTLEQQIGFVPEELQPFLNESGSLKPGGFAAFRAHLHEKVRAQLNELPETA